MVDNSRSNCIIKLLCACLLRSLQISLSFESANNNFIRLDEVVVDLSYSIIKQDIDVLKSISSSAYISGDNLFKFANKSSLIGDDVLVLRMTDEI